MQRSDFVKAAAEKVLRSMDECGFRIKSSVHVVINDNLGFMGYTVQTNGGYKIVVAGHAVSSNLIEGLLLHEMSHIFRMESLHASHYDKILDNVLNGIVVKHKISGERRLQMLHQAVNHVQDLYADDIAFKVIEEKNITTTETMKKFFLEWIKDEPAESADQKWTNAAMMLNNAFALSNMRRHGLLVGEATEKNEKFLSKVGDISESFPNFYSFMTSLKEDVDGKSFEKQLTDYLEKFVELAA